MKRSHAHSAAHNTVADGTRGAHAGAEAAEAARRYANLPDERELLEAVRQEHSLLLTLCQTYAHDMVCMAQQYEPPAVCRSLLGV